MYPFETTVQFKVAAHKQTDTYYILIAPPFNSYRAILCAYNPIEHIGYITSLCRTLSAVICLEHNNSKCTSIRVMCSKNCDVNNKKHNVSFPDYLTRNARNVA